MACGADPDNQLRRHWRSVSQYQSADRSASACQRRSDSPSTLSTPLASASKAEGAPCGSSRRWCTASRQVPLPSSSENWCSELRMCRRWRHSACIGSSSASASAASRPFNASSSSARRWSSCRRTARQQVRWPAGPAPARHAARRRVPMARAAGVRSVAQAPAKAASSCASIASCCSCDCSEASWASSSSSVGPRRARASAWPRCSAASVCSTRCAEAASAAAVSIGWLPGVRYSSRLAMAATSMQAHSGMQPAQRPTLAAGRGLRPGVHAGVARALGAQACVRSQRQCFWSGLSCAGLVLPCGPAAAGTRAALRRRAQVS